MNKDEPGLCAFSTVDHLVSKREIVQIFQITVSNMHMLLALLCVSVRVFVCVTPVHRWINLIQTEVCTLEKSVL